MKKEEKGFGDLGSELEQSIKRQDMKREEKRSTISLLIRALWFLLLVVGLVWAVFYFKKTTPLVKDINYDDVSTLEAASADDYHFKWNLDKFNDLDWNTTGQSKTHLDDIINKFGLASSAKEATIANTEGAITVNYDKDINSDIRNNYVRLTFTKHGDIYTLQTKEFYGLPVPPYTDKTSTSTGVHKWTRQEYQSLKVGSSSDGDGGVDLEFIVQKYGYPTSYETFAYNDEITLRLRYYSSEQGEDVYLKFMTKADKMSFKLSEKQGDIHD